MHNYFLRCTEADKSVVYSLAVKLGVLSETDGVYAVLGGCAWDEIGYIMTPTGRKVQVEEGGVMTEVDEMAPNADAQGQRYWHINLASPSTLTELAEAVYERTQDPTLGAAMHDMARFFFIDPTTGAPMRPKAPARVFL